MSFIIKCSKLMKTWVNFEVIKQKVLLFYTSAVISLYITCKKAKDQIT